MKTRFGDFNASLQEAPTEASAVYYEHPFPSLYSWLYFLAFIHPISFIREVTKFVCLLCQ